MSQREQKRTNEADFWQQLLGLLPEGWDTMCRESGEIQRTLRKFSGPEAILHTLMIYLLEGCSLRVTKAIAQIGTVADVSAVAVYKRLIRSGEWFRWMTEQLIEKQAKNPLPSLQKSGMKIRVVDATHVSEPGSEGSNYRVHYAFDLSQMQCAEVKVTDYKRGETFKNFTVEAKTLYMGDRGYYSATGIKYVLDGGADVLVRMSANNLALNHPDGRMFGLFSHLRTLTKTQVGDWPVCFVEPNSGDTITGRICALKKNREDARKAVQEVIYEHQRKQKRASKAALEAARYVFVFTTVSIEQLPASEALELYRGRWQIELVFKRMKSILQAGHVPNQNPIAAQAWIQGKLFCSLLIQKAIDAAERFSPLYRIQLLQAA